MRTARRGGAASDDGPPSVERRQTLLLPLIFESLDDSSGPLSVLDVGGGVAETLAFFSQYRCRLHFADLFDEPALRWIPEENAVDHFAAVFDDLLDFPADTRFDVCLLWDFLNYLPVPALTGFSRALRPYLQRGTLGHGFGAFKAAAPGVAWAAPELGLCYGVLDRDALIVRPRRDGGGAAAHPHSRTVLAEAFACFEIVRGTLLQEGAMELLLKAR